MASRLLFALALAALLAPIRSAGAQQSPSTRLKPKPSAKPGEVRNTVVEIDIVSEDGGGLRAQEWRSTLESLDISVAIRRGRGDDEPETKEKIIGTLRKVTAIGRLDGIGRLVFADRAFEPGERAKLKAWVNDLKLYGAQGSPAGQPLWGLTEEQFSAIFDGVTQISNDDLRDKPLEDAVPLLPLPSQFPVQWSDAARKRLADADRKVVVRQDTSGFSTATALAIMLRDAGLGFRPERTPSGKLQLLIDVVAADSEQFWPVGWPLKRSRQTSAPKLFELKQMFLNDRTVADVLDMAREETGVPIVFDYSDVDALGRHWASLEVLYPPRQATWHTVLRDVLNKGKLTFDLWQDEAGRPFLYVTSLKRKRIAPK
jgi:hypothetical protein